MGEIYFVGWKEVVEWNLEEVVRVDKEIVHSHERNCSVAGDICTLKIVLSKGFRRQFLKRGG